MSEKYHTRTFPNKSFTMAKGARNSVRKANNVKLKAKVFGPVEDARTERLHAKLEELIAQPKPPRSEMEIEQENKAAEAKKAEKDAAEGALHRDDILDQNQTLTFSY